MCSVQREYQGLVAVSIYEHRGRGLTECLDQRMLLLALRGLDTNREVVVLKEPARARQLEH